MTGAEHYAEAERLLACADRISDVPGIQNTPMAVGAAALQAIVAQAQVHATLALAAASGANRCTDVDSFEQRCHLEAGHDGHHGVPLAAEKAWPT